MHKNYFSLIKDKAFGPLFWVQLLGAFHDNMFRASLLIMVTYGIGIHEGFDPLKLTTLIGALAILPFFLFSSLAGQLADKHDKGKLVRVLKAIEIGVMVIASYGLYVQSLNVLLFTLFLTMIQSTFFGPIKYSLIPQILRLEKVVNANALVESSTFVAILIGTVLGGTLVSMGSWGIALLGVVMMASVVTAWKIAQRLPALHPAEPGLKLNWNLYQETIELIRYASRDRVVFLSIIGISWFWLIGSIFLTQIGAYGKLVVGAQESVAVLFLFLFAIGIGVGSYLSNRIMGREIDARVVPWGAVATTIFILDLVAVSYDINLAENLGVIAFLKTGVGIRISIDLLFIAVGSGICMVPLYALVQTQSDPKHCSRVVAANNVMNAFFMLISAAATILLLNINVTLINIFLIVGILNLFVMHRLSVLVPESLLQLVAQAILKLLFRAEVKGLQNLQLAGDRVLIIANHVSFIDPLLIFAFIPDKLNYAIYTQYIYKWWIKIVASGGGIHPVDPVNPMATKKIIELIKKGNRCVIFPEGRITVTGSLMKVFDGPGMIADCADAQILPIRIDGAQFSLFSRLKGKTRRQLFPKITVTILPPRRVEVSPELKGHDRRRVITNQMYDLMVEMIFDTSPYQETIIASLFEAARRNGMGREIAEDMQRQPITYRQLLMRSFILGGWLKNRTGHAENVGVLLPTSIGSMLCFVSLLLIGRVPAMLNFSMGAKTLIHTCKLAKLRMVLTSRKFVEMGRLEEVISQLKDHVEVVYLEDLRQEIGILDKLSGLWASFFPEFASRQYQKLVEPEDPAVILFTSGSEGTPKGVVLSHLNMNANRCQITTMIDFNNQDVLLNVLPTFHSFGLTGGVLMPLLSGIKTFLYPSPLHYRVIPVIAYDINATIFFATDTFLSRYAVAAHPYDFYSMRVVVAGAEKLRPETRRMWMDKFGILIQEGYGTTEAAPAVCFNTRMQGKPGSVGRFMPGMRHHLRPVEGVEDAGRLIVKGPNIMLGYLDPETGRINPTSASFFDGEDPQIGWYDTGDIVSVDDRGFVTIKGRAKRFAKVAGEMVSLGAVEERLYQAYPENGHVVLATPDRAKGEQLILLTTADIKREDVMDKFKSAGMSELMLPRRIFNVEEIPLLPTGKTDFGASKTLMEELMGDQMYTHEEDDADEMGAA